MVSTTILLPVSILTLSPLYTPNIVRNRGRRSNTRVSIPRTPIRVNQSVIRSVNTRNTRSERVRSNSNIRIPQPNRNVRRTQLRTPQPIRRVRPNRDRSNQPTINRPTRQTVPSRSNNQQPPRTRGGAIIKQ
jgi:hypothetical protein